MWRGPGWASLPLIAIGSVIPSAMRSACTKAGSPLLFSGQVGDGRIGTPLTALAASGTPSLRPATDAAALAKAQQVLKEARAGGDFATLAKKNSQDPGSARQGGDLGWALRGAYVQAFADKLFSMKPGEISDPVKTQFGYHIIRLAEVQPEHAKTLSDAHQQIEAD